MLGPFELAPWLSGLQEKPSKTTAEPGKEGRTDPGGMSEMKRTQLQYFIDNCKQSNSWKTSDTSLQPLTSDL